MNNYLYKPVKINSEDELKILTRRKKELINVESLSIYEEIEFRIISNLLNNYDILNLSNTNINPIEYLKKAMIDYGHQNKDLGEIIGDKSTASRILNDKRKISKAIALKISVAYNIPVEILIK